MPQDTQDDILRQPYRFRTLEEIQQDVLRSIQKTPAASVTPPENKPRREIHSVLREALEQRESKKSGKEAVITKKQIQALTKEHLYLIILDQDDEIRQLKEDIEKMNRAFQAGYEQRQE